MCSNLYARTSKVSMRKYAGSASLETLCRAISITNGRDPIKSFIDNDLVGSYSGRQLPTAVPTSQKVGEMTTPTDLPNASFARIDFRVSECEMSKIARSRRFETFCYVLYYTVLAVTLFTFGLSQPGHRVTASQLQDHQQQLSATDSTYATLPASVSESFHLDRLADVGLAELFYSDGIRDPHQHGSGTPSSLNAAVQTCGRRCLDPHPGEFRYWNGQQNGCWIQVWRAWPEGCRHFQWYNSCNGYWDSYPNGAPRVYWDCCVH
jgi:hypothetical protein